MEQKSLHFLQALTSLPEEEKDAKKNAKNNTTGK